MFKKILIANRGEIAVRVLRALKKMNIKSVMVYSDADAGSLAVELADEAVHIGANAASDSYLLADRIIYAAKTTGAEAIHPGFGFLSENAEFAEALAENNIAFIGPNSNAIKVMGDKIASKKFAEKAGVNTVPGSMGLIETPEQAAKVAAEVGYPVMIKASAGGGGKGMRVAWDKAQALEGFTSARNEAKAAFGDTRIFIEKFIEDPRHIEIQVLGDKHGNCIHLNERECSIQRRNQKVIEEAPSPFLDAKTREKMGAQAIALSKAVDYDSAGTVEFIVDKNRNFYFLEMNTRLQVEHPVTEMITGVDLVEQMIKVANGEELSLSQSDIGIDGWAMESRVYAEDPYRGFLPSIGRLKHYRTPEQTDRVRIDSGVREGDQISMFYDPMIAKLITHGPDRKTAIEEMRKALDRFEIKGVQANTPFLSAIYDQPRFCSGNITTGYISEEFPDGFDGVQANKSQIRLLSVCAAYIHARFTERAAQISGRISPVPELARDWVVLLDRHPHPLQISLCEGGADLFIDGKWQHLETRWQPGQHLFVGQFDGNEFSVQFEDLTEGYVLKARGITITALVCSPRSAEIHAILPEKEKAYTGNFVTSPMPGTIVRIDVKIGAEVQIGETLLVVEAMKMENVIRAERKAVIENVHISAGDTVSADDLLISYQ
ncbi:MAG: acetyl/propionyl/methylcrotonyl-CoA carboxylase subunit alpha [Robiginitomaculum sp.]|nr:acetyl/propionyl/methylcrotonyl-CoA carboxylase subunit alpha [Robiginitomaculum sp.]